MTPERVQEGKNIYWMVAEERHRGVVTHYVRPTLNKEEASIFFIRPDYRSACIHIGISISVYQDTIDFRTPLISGHI